MQVRNFELRKAARGASLARRRRPYAPRRRRADTYKKQYKAVTTGNGGRRARDTTDSARASLWEQKTMKIQDYLDIAQSTIELLGVIVDRRNNHEQPPAFLGYDLIENAEEVVLLDCLSELLIGYQEPRYKKIDVYAITPFVASLQQLADYYSKAVTNNDNTSDAYNALLFAQYMTLAQVLGKMLMDVEEEKEC